MQSDIILCNCDLSRDFNSLLSHVVNVLDSVDDWDFKIQTWFKFALEFFESVK